MVQCNLVKLGFLTFILMVEASFSLQASGRVEYEDFARKVTSGLDAVNCTEVKATLESDKMVYDKDAFTRELVHSYYTCDSSIQIKNTSQDEAYIEDYKWKIFDEYGDLIEKVYSPEARDLDIFLPGKGLYRGIMILNDLKSCSDTAYFIIYVLPRVDLIFDTETDKCHEGTIRLDNQSEFASDEILFWTWRLNGATVSNQFNASLFNVADDNVRIELSARDTMGCESSLIKEVHQPSFDSDPVTVTFDKVLCPGDSILFEGSYYDRPGTYISIHTSENDGCDSLTNILNIKEARLPEERRTDTTVCAGSNFTFFDVPFSEEGVYRHRIPYSGGTCDSIVHILDLKFYYPEHYSVRDTAICFSDSIFFNERWIKEAGEYSYTIEDETVDCPAGLFRLNLSKYQKPEINFTDTILCYGDSIYFDGRWLYDEGHYSTEYKNAFGCDSLVQSLQLFIEDEITIDLGPSEIFEANKDCTLDIKVNRSDANIHWTPSIGLSCDDCFNPVLNLKRSQSYSIHVRDGMNCEISEEVLFEVVEKPTYYIPNIISKTPEFNTLNQKFFIASSDKETFQYDLAIYNRWGRLIVDQKKLTMGDSDFAWIPEDVQPGVYVYVIKVYEPHGMTMLKGDVTVVR